jgi:hypothetical protein
MVMLGVSAGASCHGYISGRQLFVLVPARVMNLLDLCFQFERSSSYRVSNVLTASLLPLMSIKVRDVGVSKQS